MTFEEKKRKALSYIGFARKSGRCAVGTDSVIAEVRRAAPGTLCAVIAKDASARTRKQLADKCGSYGAAVIDDYFDSDELARAVGKKMNVSAIAVTDKNLSAALLSLAESGAETDDNAREIGGTQLKERIFPHESGK